MQLPRIFIVLTKEAITGVSVALEIVSIQIDNFSIRVLSCSCLVSGMQKRHNALCRIELMGIAS